MDLFKIGIVQTLISALAIGAGLVRAGMPAGQPVR